MHKALPGMATPHTIRLRGPWQWRWQDKVESAAAGEQRQAIVLAGVASLAEAPATFPRRYRGLLILERSFQRPTGLAPADRVELVVQSRYSGQLRLNNSDRGRIAIGNNHFPIEQALELRNAIDLRLDTENGDEFALPPCEVWLEIHS
jgi:hypothetical protein